MRSKLKLLLLVLLLFGAPALVVFSLLATKTDAMPAPAIDGSQPGGRIEGTVLDREGSRIAALEVQLALVSELDERTLAATGSTDASGRFAFDAPPVRGHYEIVAGGGPWLLVRHPFSFVDRAGRAVEEKPCEIRLERGCELELSFVHSDGRPSGDGEYELTGELEPGFLFGLVKPMVRKSGSIVAGELAVGGLPPMKAALVVRMVTGERVELALELVPGRNTKRIDY